MADFKTHLSVTSPISGLTATSLLVTDLAQPYEVFLYFIMGCIGGMLPDIDADNSVPIELAFNLLSPVIAFLVVFTQKAGSSVAELFLIWLTAFLMIRYTVFYLFTRFTVHRGLIHSVPAGILSWFLCTILLYRVFHFSNFAAWTAGFFVFFGFMIHLVIDEFSSIDFSEMRVKKSMGTALKLGDLRDPKATAVLYVTIIGLFFLTPDPNPFLSTLLEKARHPDIRFFPQDQWFQGLRNVLRRSN